MDVMCLRMRQFAKENYGMSAVELAFVLPILILLIMGIFEFGLIMFYSSSIEAAATYGARLGKTGYNDSTQTRDEYVKEKITERLRPVLDIDELTITAKTYADFGSIGTTSGVEGSGSGGNVVQYEVSYNYKFFTPVIGEFFPDNTLTIRSIATIRNEPF
jgi:Flp pilus assembly protein TadG